MQSMQPGDAAGSEDIDIFCSPKSLASEEAWLAPITASSETADGAAYFPGPSDAGGGDMAVASSRMVTSRAAGAFTGDDKSESEIGC